MKSAISFENEAESDSLPHYELTSLIINSCFEIMKELGTGFLESIYKNALYFSLKDQGLLVEVEKPYEIKYREQKIGYYKADLVVQSTVIVEAKCCKSLIVDQHAQVINYLKASSLPVGLLVNFGNPKLEYKRLHHPTLYEKIANSKMLSRKDN